MQMGLTSLAPLVRVYQRIDGKEGCQSKGPASQECLKLAHNCRGKLTFRVRPNYAYAILENLLEEWAIFWLSALFHNYGDVFSGQAARLISLALSLVNRLARSARVNAH